MLMLFNRKAGKKSNDNRPIDPRMKRKAIKALLPYGLIHVPVTYFGILYPKPIIEEWYFPIVYWIALLGPAVVGGQWYVRVAWKDWKKKQMKHEDESG